MLGFKKNTEPLPIDMSIEIRQAMLRRSSGSLTHQERASVKRERKLSSKYKVEWR